MDGSPTLERLENVLDQFIKQRREHRDETWAGYRQTFKRMRCEHEAYPMLQQTNLEFLAKQQQLLHQEIVDGDISMEELRNFLVILTGHVLGLQERAHSLVILGIFIAASLVLLNLLGLGVKPIIVWAASVVMVGLSLFLPFERDQNHRWVVAYKEFILLIEREIERGTTSGAREKTR